MTPAQRAALDEARQVARELRAALKHMSLCEGRKGSRSASDDLDQIVRALDAAGASGSPVTFAELAGAVVDLAALADRLRFQDTGTFEGDGQTRQAVTVVVALANRLRPPGRLCGHQNEDHLNLRCRRRWGHGGRHGSRRQGATW